MNVIGTTGKQRAIMISIAEVCACNHADILHVYVDVESLVRIMCTCEMNTV